MIVCPYQLDRGRYMVAERPPSEVWNILVTSPDVMQDSVRARGFLQGMMNRMGFSYHKYGSIHDNFPHRRHGVENALQRIEMYQKDGNLEWLIDAANYLLIENLVPSHSGAHFKATTSEESPGAVNQDGSVSHGKD
jgi:hypothetical protein